MKVAVISSNKTQLEQVCKTLAQVTPERDILAHAEEHGVMASVVAEERPDLMILDAKHYQTQAAMAELEQLIQCNPGLSVIQLSEHMSPECLMNAMHIGVREVLPLPLDAKQLLAAVSHWTKKTVPPANNVPAKGKVLAFIACKGGSGATFLATNLAYILAEKHQARVIFLDLNLQLGDAVLFLNDQEPANSLADVAENIGRLDLSFLNASMLQILPNLSMLAAPDSPERAVNVRPEHIETILRLAKSHYDFVVLDVGRVLSSVTLKALDLADVVYPVLQETLPFIRDAKRLIRTMQSLGYDNQKIQPLVNRHERSGEILLNDVESALGMRVYKTIPNSYENVTTSVNQGIPIYKIDKRDAVSIALLKMAADLAETAEEEKDGWLSRVLHGRE